MSKMIVIDGLDGSGKATQAEILTNYLKSQGYETYTLDLPFYNDPSSTLVKMYLHGEFGKNPDDVKIRYAFAFPDTYEVGVSHLGMKILYHI